MLLPTKDAYLKTFRDAILSGEPLAKCIKMGVMVKGEPDYNHSFDAAATFRKAMRDGLKQGLTVDRAIERAVAACV